jgi:hypothetical protein
MKLNREHYEVKFKIRREVELSPELVLEKIESYLKSNYYKVIGMSSTEILFTTIEDNRIVNKSDYYKRVDKGKFEIQQLDGRTIVSFSYLVPIGFEAIVGTAFLFTGIMTSSVPVLVIPTVFGLQIVFKVYYLKAYVVKSLLEC